ncbi:hypothetical protein [Vibrio owensii]|uniref:hypothetical protein n=1 Tax=Vibrio owensii TaxID=696485 RepID=UPI003CC610C8
MLLSICVKGDASHINLFASDFHAGSPQEFIDSIKGNSEPHTMDHTSGMILGNMVNEEEFTVTYKRQDNVNIFDVPFFDAMAKKYAGLQIEAQYANEHEESIGGILYVKGDYIDHYQLSGKEKICDSLISFIVQSKPYQQPGACEDLIESVSRKVDKNLSQSYPSQDQTYVLDHYKINIANGELTLQLLFDEVDKFYDGIPTDMYLDGKEYVLIEDCVRIEGSEISYRLWELLEKAPVVDFIRFVPMCWSLFQAK